MLNEHGTRAVSISVVVPVYNSMSYLPKTLPALLTAARLQGDTDIVFVDNGSTDGSYEYLLSHHEKSLRVYRLENASVAAVRNFGAAQSTGGRLSFLDADCLISPTYFHAAEAALIRSGAAATGCRVDVPRPAHWIEDAWHDLHYIGRDRFVHYLNSGNLFVTREAFEAVGGFDETLPTGEDTELGQRLNTAHHRMFESTAVRAVHLGNPKSLKDHYRRCVWHAIGMFGTLKQHRMDKPTVMMLTHLSASLAGVVILATDLLPFAAGLLAFVALQLFVPSITIVFRAIETRRVPPIGPSLLLYWLYFWARIHALTLLILRRTFTK